MARDDLPLTRAKAASRDYEISLPERQRLATNHAAIGNPALRDQGQNQIEKALTEKSHDRDTQQQRRKSPDDFNQLLNEKVDYRRNIPRSPRD